MKRATRTVILMTCLLNQPSANAVMPVIDVQSITQLREQIGYWRQQLAAMSSEVNTLRTELQSLTGTRGMGQLNTLTFAARNYLPESATDIVKTLNGGTGSGSYGALRGDYLSAVNAQTLLSASVLAKMGPTDRSVIIDRRNAVATLSSLMQVAVSNASNRYRALQALIDEIDRTDDPKGILDLQGRIAGEQLMLNNDLAKLQSLESWSASQLNVSQTRAREAVVEGHGNFDGRFHPGAR